MKHLILGNGPAGVIAAETLRKNDPDAQILMVGAEPGSPYSRMAIPYLLEGRIGEEGTHLRKDASHFDALNIGLKNARAVSLDTEERRVGFDDGSAEGYDRLLIATGSHPIRPPVPGIDLPQVLTCWTLEDARRIAASLSPGTRIVQVGAGFIGSIIIEPLVKSGAELTIVEMGDRMVPRMMTPVAGDMIRRWIEGRGVRVIPSTRVESISEDVGGELTVSLSDGQGIACDLVIMSAGVRPNVDFLEGSGVEINHGILTDAQMHTSAEGVFAAGDVAEAPDLFSGTPMVSAIQPNAVEQGRIAALNMAGKSARHSGVLPINVLDTLGLISTSFGQWEGVRGGDGVELVDEARFRYLSLKFDGDVLVGATSIGLTDHAGVFRGLIQGRVALGAWKDTLMKEPLRVSEAYLATAQKPPVLGGRS